MMKNFTVLMCLFLAIGVSQKTFAQFNQGRWLAGGSMSLTTRSSKTDFVNLGEVKSTTITFSLGPQVGYFVINNLAVGAAVNFFSSGVRGTTVDPNTGTVVDFESKNNSVSIGPFVRYYLPSSIFFQVKGDLGTGKNSYEGGTTNFEGKTNVLNYGAAIGYAYFINDYVAVEPMIGYQSYGGTFNDSSSRQAYWYLNAAFTIYLGERK